MKPIRQTRPITTYSSEIPTQPSEDPCTKVISDGNSAAQGKQDDNNFTSDNSSDSDPDWEDSVETPSSTTPSTSLNNSVDLSETSPRSDINLDHFFDHSTIDNDDVEEATKSKIREKLDKMVTA